MFICRFLKNITIHWMIRNKKAPLPRGFAHDILIFSKHIIFLAGVEYLLVLDMTNTGYLQGIFIFLRPLFSPAAPNFRDFHKIPSRNNREFSYTKQGFFLTISGNKFTTFIPLYVRNDNNWYLIMGIFPGIIMTTCQRYSQSVLAVKAQMCLWMC